MNFVLGFIFGAIGTFVFIAWLLHDDQAMDHHTKYKKYEKRK